MKLRFFDPSQELMADSTSTHGNMSQETRDKYLKALNELVGTLPLLHSWKEIDVDQFCAKHGLKPSFFDALRDLDGIVLNQFSTKPHFYNKTQNLVSITPEQVLNQMKSLGRRNYIAAQKRASREEQKPEEVPIEKPKATQAEIDDAIADYKQSISDPEEITIKTASGSEFTGVIGIISGLTESSPEPEEGVFVKYISGVDPYATHTIPENEEVRAYLHNTIVRSNEVGEKETIVFDTEPDKNYQLVPIPENQEAMTSQNPTPQIPFDDTFTQSDPIQETSAFKPISIEIISERCDLKYQITSSVDSELVIDFIDRLSKISA